MDKCPAPWNADLIVKVRRDWGVHIVLYMLSALSHKYNSVCLI